MSSRVDRSPYDPRPVKITPGFLGNALGSCLIECGRTRVICAATASEGVPPHIREGGWLSATYAMLPASTHSRKEREGLRQDGRTVEIQRLIGRSLRMAVETKQLDALTLWVDCDVIEADGGTRTASITGGYVALALALKALVKKGRLPRTPLARPLAAISVGQVGGEWRVDLDYREDSQAQVDLNCVFSPQGLIEVQGTGEKAPFSISDLSEAVRMAESAVRQLFLAQTEALGS